MSIYYLMVKTHNITGLKYLCQTKKKDPHRYLGSGVEWTTHLKKFGKTIRTEILFQTDNKQEINDVGRYYSKLWKITTSMDDFGNRIWANAIPETGGGPGIPNPSNEVNKKRAAKLKGRVFPHMRAPRSDETKQKMGAWQKGVPKGPMSEEQKQLRRDKQKGVPKGPQQKLTCHCGAAGGASMMRRWHFNNCKKIN